MHIHFLGIGGTLMGNLALLARASGDTVTGSDRGLYPPMSDQLAAAGIPVTLGWEHDQLEPAPDLVVVGNADLPRGNPALERVLDRGLPYVSGAEWLGTHLLRGRWVIAVAGTHGKTTTTAMIAWILREAGMDPGWLVGGVPNDLPTPSALGGSPFFVVEADEYDTSYFDRRAKFVHYRPRTLIINNLEYDHADLYPDLATIQQQFHLLLRAVPGNGLVIVPDHDENVEHVLKAGCWTPVQTIRGTAARRKSRRPAGDPAALEVETVNADGSRFDVRVDGATVGTVEWSLLGQHNVHNALAAIAAARHAGVPVAQSVAALCRFTGVKRRLEVVGQVGDVIVYDDFAHHPTAIRTTLQGLRNRFAGDEIVAVIEPRSHTMKLGTLKDDLATCTSAADQALWLRPPALRWDLGEVMHASVIPSRVDDSVADLIAHIAELPPPATRRHVIVMSNGSFDGIHQKLVAALREAAAGGGAQ